MSRNKDARDKLVQDKLKQILDELLRSEDNKYCADCNTKGPRWASHNIGVFMCIRCAGIHRNLGVHISKVKSVALDSWTPEQVAIMKETGNSRGRAIYEATVPDGFHRPQSDMEVERLIRDKYDKKKYIAKEWKPSVNKPDVASLGLDDVLLGRKSSKSAGAAPAVVLPPPSTASASLKQKLAISPSNPDRASQVKTAAAAASVSTNADTAVSTVVSAVPPPASTSISTAAASVDLLGIGLDNPATTNNGNNDEDDGDDDDFGNFLTAPSSAADESTTTPTITNDNNNTIDNDAKSKDSIMALFGTSSHQNNLNNNSIRMSTPPMSATPAFSANNVNAAANPSESRPATSHDLLGQGQAQNGWPATQGLLPPGNPGMTWAGNGYSQAPSSTVGFVPANGVAIGAMPNSLIPAMAPTMTSAMVPNIAPTMAQAMTPQQMALQGGHVNAQSGYQQPGGFGVNPFWDNPSMTSPSAPTAYSNTQTQVSFSSSAQLQQQQRFQPPQMYSQQYSHFQRPQATYNGVQGSHMMSQMGNIPRPSQAQQQFAQQQQMQQVQQQMAGMKMEPGAGGFSSLANSSISFLD